MQWSPVSSLVPECWRYPLTGCLPVGTSQDPHWAGHKISMEGTRAVLQYGTNRSIYSLGMNTDLLIRQMLIKLWVNGKHNKPLFTQQMVIFFRIYWAHLPTIYWVQQMSGFFTIFWITWSSFPHWVNLRKNQSNTTTIYWASKFRVFSQFTGSCDHNLLIR